MRSLIYYAELHREKDGSGYWVSFPDVPEALTDGATKEEALASASDALVTALGGYVEAGKKIPQSKRRKGLHGVPVPPLVAAKLALHDAIQTQRLSARALARRLDMQETAVRRLLDLGHRSHIGEVERALMELGLRLSVRVEKIAA